jgi:DNA-binding response OmpR family regulator
LGGEPPRKTPIADTFITKKNYFCLNSNRISTYAFRPALLSSRAVNNTLRILIVDDQASLLLTYKLILQQQGYRVNAASTCQQAIEYLKQSVFDVVMCDLALENENSGFDVIDFARSCHAHIQTVLLTGLLAGEVDEEAERRAITVLHKPLEVRLLLETMDTLRTRCSTPGPRDTGRTPMAMQPAQISS